MPMSNFSFTLAVYTGHRVSAGTSAHICFKIIGKLCVDLAVAHRLVHVHVAAWCLADESFFKTISACNILCTLSNICVQSCNYVVI